MFEIKIRTDFSAAHQLSLINNKCEKLHGHNWKVEVCLLGEKLDQLGLLIDFGIVKKKLKKIINKLDHEFLNNIDFFKKNSPSSENIAKFIFKKLDPEININNIYINKISIWESENTCATYLPHNQK